MAEEGSALVVIQPEDGIDAILKKIRAAGTTRVQVLVPDGIKALQSSDSYETLRRSLTQDQIDMEIISSDETILKTARSNQFNTIAVQGTHVTLTGESIPASPPARQTRDTDADLSLLLAQAPTAASPPKQPAPASTPAPADTEAEFDPFSELDDLGDVLSGQQPASASGEYDAFADELDSLSDTLSQSAPASADYDPFADELDSLSSTLSGATSAQASTARPAATPQARPRIRPEDIELSAEEKKQAASVRTGGGRKETPGKKEPKTPRSTAAERKAASMGAFGQQQHASISASNLSAPMNAFGIIIALVIIVFGAYIVLFGKRTTVTVALPALTQQTIAFDNQPLPIAEAGSEATDQAVRAERISALVVFTTTGQVQSETMSPGAAANGSITMLNQGTQPVSFPAGTEFIATNTQGQEVRFVSDGPINVPSSTTDRQGRQIVTTMGETQATITARSAGSNSNINANAITHIVPPGQPPIQVNAGGIFLEHGAITGGSEQTIRIVKDSDVQNKLSEALTGLSNQARETLASTAQAMNLELEATTTSPTEEAIARGEGYEVTVIPPVGQPVDDPANATFYVQVRGQFHALATPADKPLNQQLPTVAFNQLQNQGVITPGLNLVAEVQDWHWDGSSLTTDGILKPSETQGSGLDPAKRIAILNALKGKTQQQAQATLEQFKQEGTISGYQLPNVQKLPAWDFQLVLDVVPAAQ